MRQWFRFVCLVTLAAGFPGLAAAQDDGARAYVPPPENLHVVSLFAFTIDGNRSGDPATVLQNAELNLDFLIPMYTFSYGIGGKSAIAFGVLPLGRVSGKVQTTLGDSSLATSGAGDFLVGTAITLLGAPPMTLKEYAEFKPTTTLGVFAKLYIPTGQYDSSQQLNMGASRWAVAIGLPMSTYFGTSLVDPHLLSVDFYPSVTLFTDNHDPFGAARTSQDYLIRLEGHVAKNLNAKTFISFDALYVNGGATYADGVQAAGRQESLAIGGSVNYVLTAHNSFRLTYGQTVARNDVGLDGTMWRLMWNYVF